MASCVVGSISSPMVMEVVVVGVVVVVAAVELLFLLLLLCAEEVTALINWPWSGAYLCSKEVNMSIPPEADALRAPPAVEVIAEEEDTCNCCENRCGERVASGGVQHHL